MRRLALFALIMAAGARIAAADRPAACPDFDRYFTAKSLRIDLYHTGDAKSETYSLDELRIEPHWAGNPRALLDTLNLGTCILRVFDLKTNAMIYSRGFSTHFDEWKTTGEAIAGFPGPFTSRSSSRCRRAPCR